MACAHGQFGAHHFSNNHTYDTCSCYEQLCILTVTCVTHVGTGGWYLYKRAADESRRRRWPCCRRHRWQLGGGGWTSAAADRVHLQRQAHTLQVCFHTFARFVHRGVCAFRLATSDDAHTFKDTSLHSQQSGSLTQSSWRTVLHGAVRRGEGWGLSVTFRYMLIVISRQQWSTVFLVRLQSAVPYVDFSILS